MKSKKKKIDYLFEENKEAVSVYNANFYPKLAGIGFMITALALAGSFLYPALKEARLMYSVMGIVCLVLYLFSKTEKLSKYAVLWVYVETAALFVLVLYLSLVVSPQRAATSILILLTIFPITFIDKPEHLIITETLMFLIHTIASFLCKGGSLGILDMINCLVAALVGCFCSVYILETKLQNFNLSRLLAYEKETDILTSLGNRRKLVQTIFAIEKEEVERPLGVMLFDIDHFKQYNDHYGHQSGDKCLRAFGKMLKEEDWGAEVVFYRYGGEEFVGFLWNIEKEQLGIVAEKIRKRTEAIELEQGKVTTSIGFVYCEDSALISYEKWINRADKAAYAAKEKGRNCTVAYEESMG